MANFPHSKKSGVNKRPKYRVGSNIKRFRQLPKLRLHLEDRDKVERSDNPRKISRVKK